jgi:hypothetical protein
VDRLLPLNEEGADAFIATIADATVKELVRLAYVAARMEYAHQRYPAAPFDMEFFVRTVAAAYARPQLVRQVLGGLTVAKATGWDALNEDE